MQLENIELSENTILTSIVAVMYPFANSLIGLFCWSVRDDIRLRPLAHLHIELGGLVMILGLDYLLICLLN